MVLFPDEDNEMFQLVEMILQIMFEAWEQCEIVHIEPSANLPAAAIANHEITHGEGGIEDLLVPPSSVRMLQNEDKMA